MLEPGKFYRHPNMLDLDIYVISVETDGIHIVYINTHTRAPIADEIIQIKNMDLWKEIP